MRPILPAPGEEAVHSAPRCGHIGGVEHYGRLFMVDAGRLGPASSLAGGLSCFWCGMAG
ncbi:hypothetical protein ART_1414 [Arthrobacter sp. PAMC 25486]|nr:hypothetical protein ART_1414 [Arthrobacter sp. PAMC 25486]